VEETVLIFLKSRILGASDECQRQENCVSHDLLFEPHAEYAYWETDSNHRESDRKIN
jgi:hypothetical protein